MNPEFLIAIAFGFGVSGLLLKPSKSAQLSLTNRVSGVALLPKWGARNSVIKTFFENSIEVFRRANTKKIERALFELPEIIDLLVVCLKAGDGVYRSFEKVVPKASGELARELTKILLAVSYGAAFATEIKKLPLALPHPQFAELASKVALALARGTPLATMLTDQGESSRAEIRNRLLKQAGKNETRMLIPLVFLILPVTILFAIYPSLKLLNFGFI
jgi:tight adherence protein C